MPDAIHIPNAISVGNVLIERITDADRKIDKRIKIEPDSRFQPGSFEKIGDGKYRCQSLH